MTGRLGRGYRFTLSENHERRIDHLSTVWNKSRSATVRAVLAVGLKTCEKDAATVPEIVEMLRAEDGTWGATAEGQARGGERGWDEE